jgi:ubiquinone/menaquinone biosynthesis C-methylase UbiE
MLVDQGTVAGNVTDKYQCRNPIGRRLMERFLDTVGGLFVSMGAERVLEVGAGEGELCGVLWEQSGQTRRFVATDLSPAILQVANQRHDFLDTSAHSATALGFADKSFDLVLACEVLEHLEDPLAALRELARVSARHVILSVPREPLWRTLNIVRGAYLADLGNTPGHVQHWSRSSFVRFVSQHLRVLEVHSPVPWTVVAAAVD